VNIAIYPIGSCVMQALTAREREILSGLLRTHPGQGVGNLDSLDMLSGLNVTANPRLNNLANSTLNGLLPSKGTESDANLLSPELLLLAAKCLNTAQESLLAVRALSNYNGPLPVPSFDSYVGLHRLVVKGLGLYFLL
jgi:hypothetical protein